MPKPDYYLVEIFIRDHMGNRIRVGKRQTLLDNYTLCVDMRDHTKSYEDIQTIELEFKGKVEKGD